MKPCEFVKLSYSEDDAKNLPISIQFAQTQISKSSSVTDIEGSVGNGALPYFIEIYGVRSGANISSCPANIKKLYDLFNDYKRPGITRAYLSSLFYVFKLSDYGSQALSPEFTDFTISCYNKDGAKINHTYTALIRELNSRDAYVLIDKTGITINKGDMLTVRISYKINNNNKKLLKLKKSDTKYNCFYYDPEETDDFHELSILASADSYCFYKKSGETFYPLLNSFVFSLVKQENKSYIKTAPQTGHMIKNNEALPTTEGGIVIADNITDVSKIHISDDGALILDTLYDDINSDMIKEDNVNIVIDSNPVNNNVKMILEPDTVSDYFRQLYNSRKSGSVEKVSTPSMRDRYIIEFYPQVDINIISGEEVYLGTRMLEDDVFFYDSVTFNKTLNDVSCKNTDVEVDGVTKTQHSDEISTNTAYRFNSMDQFEVYEFDSKSSPFGKKIPVEHDDLYDGDNKSKLFKTDYSVSDGVYYEIVPRFDNQMFASITCKKPDSGTIRDMINYNHIYNYTKANNIYAFRDGYLYSGGVCSFGDKFSTIGGAVIEICLHIPYEKETDINYKYTTTEDYSEYCYNNKHIFRDGYYINKYDIGLNISSDDISSDGHVYIHPSTEPVAFRDNEPVVRYDSDKFYITKNSNTDQNHDVCFNSLKTNAINCHTDHNNNITNVFNDDKFKLLYNFEKNYRDSIVNNAEDSDYVIDKQILETINGKEYIISDNIVSIIIPSAMLPMYVYKYDTNNNKDILIDVIYPDVNDITKNTSTKGNNVIYIPFYRDVEDTDADTRLRFLDKDGIDKTVELRLQLRLGDTYWNKILEE